MTAPHAFAATYDRLSRSAFSALGCALLARGSISPEEEKALHLLDRAIVQIRAASEGMGAMFDALRAEAAARVEAISAAERRAKAASMDAFFILAEEGGDPAEAQVFASLDDVAEKAAENGGGGARVLKVENGLAEDVTEEARGIALEFVEDLREAPEFVQAGSEWSDLMDAARDGYAAE